MTKRMLAMEWAMSVEEAIEAEAVAQALCMTTEDFAAPSRRSRTSGPRCSRGIEGGLLGSCPGRGERSLRCSAEPGPHYGPRNSSAPLRAALHPGHEILPPCPKITLDLK